MVLNVSVASQKLGHLKIFLGRLTFHCVHLLRMKLVESNNNKKDQTHGNLCISMSNSRSEDLFFFSSSPQDQRYTVQSFVIHEPD